MSKIVGKITIQGIVNNKADKQVPIKETIILKATDKKGVPVSQSESAIAKTNDKGQFVFNMPLELKTVPGMNASVPSPISQYITAFVPGYSNLTAPISFEQGTTTPKSMVFEVMPEKGSEFAPHMMFKDNKSEMADTFEEYEMLKKKGYTNQQPVKETKGWSSFSTTRKALIISFFSIGLISLTFGVIKYVKTNK
tara:strand:- start:1894 stop:2478 length:585 start_codon:yes stop_codon:yes gene_type:complete